MADAGMEGHPYLTLWTSMGAEHMRGNLYGRMCEYSELRIAVGWPI